MECDKSELKMKKCEKCKHMYDHSKHKPYVLTPCGHSLCIDCINRLVNSACPLCDKSFFRKRPDWLELKLGRLPDSNYDKLKSNLKHHMTNINSLKSKFEFTKKKKLKETKLKIKHTTDDVNKKATDLITLVLNEKKKLINEIKQLENEINNELNEITTAAAASQTDLFNVNLNDAELNEHDLELLNEKALRFKTDLECKINKVNAIENDYEMDTSPFVNEWNGELGMIALKDLSAVRISFYECEENLHQNVKDIESELIRKGDLLCKQLKEYTKAIEAYDQVIEMNPRSVEAYNSKGNALFEMKDYAAAIDYFDASIEIDSTFVNAFNNKGNCLFALKYFDQAIEQYNHALAIDSMYLHSYNGKGNALLEKQKYDDAIECFRKAIEIDSGYVLAYNGYGNALLKSEEFDSALECFDMALQLENPFFLDAYNGKGLAYMGKRDYDAAVHYFNRTIQLDPTNVDAWHNKGVAMYFKANFDAALECFNKALSINNNYSLALLNKELTSEIISIFN